MEPGSSLALRNARISRPPFEISASYSWRNIWNKRDSCLLPQISPYTLSLSWEGLINRLYLKGRSPYYLLAFSSASLDSLGISPVTAWRRPVDHKVLESQCVKWESPIPSLFQFQFSWRVSILQCISVAPGGEISNNLLHISATSSLTQRYPFSLVNPAPSRDLMQDQFQKHC